MNHFKEHILAQPKALDFIGDHREPIKIAAQPIFQPVVKRVRGRERQEISRRRFLSQTGCHYAHQFTPHLGLIWHWLTPVPEARVQVRDYELFDLFFAMRFPDLVDAGCLIEDVSYRSVGSAKSCDGTSYVIRLRDKTDSVVAIVHYLTCSTGETLPFPTAIRVGAVRIYRVGHDRRPGTSPVHPTNAHG